MRPTGHGRAKGLVSSRKSGDRVRAWRYAPCRALADVVECYWVGQWDLRDQGPHHSEMLSDPCMHFVIEDGPKGCSCRWVGVWSKRWQRTMKDWGQVWGVKLKVGAVRAFLKNPASEYSNKIWSLTPQDAWYCPKLLKQVTTAEEHAKSFAAIEAWLLAHRRPQSEEIDQALAAIQCLEDDSELLTMEAWAARLELSPRALQRLFRAHVGVTPKWVLRRKRLQDAALRIEASRDGQSQLSLTRLAHELGYTDHPHFCRDFKRAVGKTPTEFLRQED